MRPAFALIPLLVLINLATVSAGVVTGKFSGNLANYVNETLMGEMASPFATEFFEKCAREHGNRTVMEIVDTFLNTKECMGPLFHEHKEGTFVHIGLMLVQTVDKTEICHNHAPVIEKCMADAIDSLKVCTGDVGRNDLDVVKSAVSGAIRYLCQNEGESLKRFVIEDGTHCLLNGPGEKLLNWLKQRSLLFTELGENKSIFSENNCRIHAMSNECMIEAYSVCPKESPEENNKFIAGVINAAFEAMPCSSGTANSSFITSGVTSVSLTSYILALLLVFSIYFNL